MKQHQCPHCDATFTLSPADYWRAARALPCPSCGGRVVVKGAPCYLRTDNALAAEQAEYDAAYATIARLRGAS